MIFGRQLECRSRFTIGQNCNFKLGKFKGQVKAGLYAQNSHYLVELKDCLVQDPDIQAIANDLTDLLTHYQIPIADERKELGVRTMMVRRARKSGQVQIIVVTSRQINVNNLVQDLVTKHPEIVTVAVNKNTSRSSEIYGEQTQIIWGEDAIWKVFWIMNSPCLLEPFTS